MKNKYIIIILSVLLITSGCSGKDDTGTKKSIFSSNKILECVKTEVDEEGFESVETMLVTYNKSKVLSMKSTNVIETDPEYLEMQLSFGIAFTEAFNAIDGMRFTYEKINESTYKVITEIDYSKINIDQIREKLGVLYDENEGIYSKDSFTIDEFKEENLSDYTCK